MNAKKGKNTFDLNLNDIACSRVDWKNQIRKEVDMALRKLEGEREGVWTVPYLCTFSQNWMEGVEKMSELEVKIYHHPNPEIKSFLTSVAISTPRVEKFKKPLEEEWENALGPLGVIGTQVIKEILAIQEVREIQIKPKELRIKKEASCSWEKIEGKIIAILMRALQKKQFRLIKA